MRTLLTSACILLSTIASFGADAVPADEVPVINAEQSVPAMPVAERWGGFYAGASIGYGFLKDTIPAEGKDWAYGGFVGYNFQSGNFVAGVEGTIDYADILFNDGSGIRSEYMYSARARAGWGNDMLLAYGSIGVEHGTTVNLPPANSKDTALQFGAGVDFALTDKISLGTGYTIARYNKFGNLPLDVTTQKIQARVTYTFN
jgi:outer membrane immunogenic protein